MFEAVALLFVAVLGAAIGSFLNVVIYRLPLGLSLLHPPSRCPYCRRSLRPQDNVPIIGWLKLKGRCHFCQHRIPARYPIVEAFTAALFVLLAVQFGWSTATVGGWILFSWLVALSVIDLDTMTLPNALTASGLTVGVAFQLAIAPANWPVTLFWSLFVAIAALWLSDLFRWVGEFVLRQPVLGGGDSKLLALLGVWLGGPKLLLALFLACLSGAIAGGIGRWRGTLKPMQAMPFGPFLALGGAIAWIWGAEWIDRYIRIVLS
ncbi:prepilin peptidase [Synechococcus elongatus]|uniref:prepilin peptidase n=1 Tax=Synechococcus elongatus TaxID=32046 RepID=UPI0030CD95BB